MSGEFPTRARRVAGAHRALGPGTTTRTSPRSTGWTSARPSSPSSAPAARTAWARNAPTGRAASSSRRGARRWRPTSSSSNHHLFFADMTLRDTGVAELLPSVEIAIFDEAHQLAEAGVQFLGTLLGTAALIDFRPRHAGPGPGACARRERLAGPACRRREGGARAAPSRRRRTRHGRARAARHAEAGLEGAGHASPPSARRLPVSSRLCLRAGAGSADRRARGGARLSHVFASAPSSCATWRSIFAADPDPGDVRWIDISPHAARLVESPLDIRDAMQQQLGRPAQGVGLHVCHAGRRRGADLVHRARRADRRRDLARRQPVRLPGPCAAVRAAAVFPKPAEPTPCAQRRAAGLAAGACPGRPHLRADDDAAQPADRVRRAARALRGGGGTPSPCCSRARHRSACCCSASSTARPRCWSARRASWEGIDVPGDALQCVVIDKLPFPPPNDPLVEARVQRLEAQGRNAFSEYFIAEAAIALKQGAGRPHPHRDRPRPAGGVRPAHGRHELRPPPARCAATDDAGGQRGRGAGMAAAAERGANLRGRAGRCPARNEKRA